MASMLLPTIARASTAFSGLLRIVRRAGLAAMTAAALCSLAAPAGAQAQKSPDTFQSIAPHAILIDADTDTVLFEKNPDQLMYPASLNKLMTTAVVLNEIKIFVVRFSSVADAICGEVAVTVQLVSRSSGT